MAKINTTFKPIAPTWPSEPMMDRLRACVTQLNIAGVLMPHERAKILNRITRVIIVDAAQPAR